MRNIRTLLVGLLFVAAIGCGKTASEDDVSKPERAKPLVIVPTGDSNLIFSRQNWEQVKVGMTLREAAKLLHLDTHPNSMLLPREETMSKDKEYTVTFREGGVTIDGPRTMTLKLIGPKIVEKSQQGLK